MWWRWARLITRPATRRRPSPPTSRATTPSSSSVLATTSSSAASRVTAPSARRSTSASPRSPPPLLLPWPPPPPLLLAAAPSVRAAERPPLPCPPPVPTGLPRLRLLPFWVLPWLCSPPPPYLLLFCNYCVDALLCEQHFCFSTDWDSGGRLYVRGFCTSSFLWSDWNIKYACDVVVCILYFYVRF